MRSSLCLHQISYSPDTASFEANRFSRLNRAQNFRAPNCGEFQTAHRRNLRIALGDRARKLRRAFDQQHARHERLIWEMPAKERLITAQRVFTSTALTGIE